MSWIGAAVHDLVLREVYAEVADLASWSEWEPFETAVALAPREPGVYLFRDRTTEAILFVGMAGERAGAGRPQGLHGRLGGYRTPHAPVGGFAEAALDLALADEAWLGERVARRRDRGPESSRVWARDAVARLAPEVSWALRADAPDARHLEGQVVALLRPHGIWNR